MQAYLLKRDAHSATVQIKYDGKRYTLVLGKVRLSEGAPFTVVLGSESSHDHLSFNEFKALKVRALNLANG